MHLAIVLVSLESSLYDIVDAYSEASSQAPEGLSLQRELDFQFQQGSHYRPHLGSILEPKRGPSAL